MCLKPNQALLKQPLLGTRTQAPTPARSANLYWSRHGQRSSFLMGGIVSVLGCLRPSSQHPQKARLCILLCLPQVYLPITCGQEESYVQTHHLQPLRATPLPYVEQSASLPWASETLFTLGRFCSAQATIALCGPPNSALPVGDI